MTQRLFTGVLLLGLAAPGTAARGACPLDESLPAAAVVRLTEKDTYEAARTLARRNQEHLARIDALLRSGAFGPAHGAEARRQAHLMARLSLLNVYAYLFRYAEDRERVYEADAQALSAVFASFCR